MKKLVIDLDGTLTIDDKNVPYEKKKVNQEVLEKLKIYKKMGFKITIFTSRNMKTYRGDIEKIKALTLPKIKTWLAENHIVYDELIVGKPWCGDEGFYIDDKAIRPLEFSTLDFKEITQLLNTKKQQKAVLITSAKYLSDEFTLEFGQIVPSFLPLGNKRLYEYQAKLFKDCRIFLSLPKDFKINTFDLKKFKNLGIKPLFVPNDLNLGESIVYCINLLCEDELYIIHGDCFFKDLELIPNSLVLARVKENYNWAYMDKDFKIKNSEELDENLILAGAFHIQNTRVLTRTIVRNGYSFFKGLKSYSKILPFTILKNDSWLDFGLLTNYFHSKKVIQTQRSFNTLTHNKWGGGMVQKTSSWLKKIEAEISWFESLPKELCIFIPQFLRGQGCYFTEYIYNNTLAELFVFGKLPNYVWVRIFYSLKDFLDKLHSFKNENLVLNFDYKAKILQRLEEFSKQNNIDLNQKWQLGDKTLPSILELVKKLDKYIKSPKCYTLIHGDFCFSNIMYDFRANSIKTFDPRGMDFDEKISNFGDANYDLAKLVHSVFGYYDFIIAGFYNLKIKANTIQFSFFHHNELKNIQKSFLEIFKPDKEIFALNIHLFLSMLPLHKDCKERQMAFLANALRLFDEFFEEEL